ncbi:unnamed protein product [Spirodela intermedia]|uniref:Exocyst subunit Exo70 family protein n=1 Tax=Spirodela intermedia TaxID=51605 RepID=A0A7I8IGU0_SPIIN|nr:unnamed protein product [Spirodela intermedia]CAA6656913.1 unnamed protein product [Spirodela intermedia]
MDLLQENLDAKSRVYEAPGQNFVFLLNNGWYIIQKVKDSEIVRVRQWRNSYQKATWGKVIEVLQIAGLSGLSSSLVVRSLRDKLHMFNVYFEEIYRTQKGWVVVDEHLRADLRKSVMQAVLPAYQRFLERLMSLEAAKDLEKYVNYSVDGVEACIGELFQGTSGVSRKIVPFLYHLHILIL